MRAKPPVRTRSVVAMSAAAVLVSVAALVVVLAPESSASTLATLSTLPLPLPVAGVESLVTEGVTIEGPLVNNLNLPQLK